MKTNKQVIEELKTERIEVMTRLAKLNAFSVTAEFEKQSSKQRDLMHRQGQAMSDYVGALYERIKDLEAEHE